MGCEPADCLTGGCLQQSRPSHSGHRGSTRRLINAAVSLSKISEVKIYKGLLSTTRKIVNQAKRVMEEVDQLGQRKKKQFSGLRSRLATMVGRVQQVVRQTRARVFGGNTKFEESS